MVSNSGRAQPGGLRLAASVLIMAAGAFAISLAYAEGRARSGGETWTALYWLGEAVIFAPPAWRALSRRGPGEYEAVGLVLSLAIATYLVKYAYSPLAFRFPDELEHWRSAVNVLSSRHLFGVNYVLPISSGYPGLEEVTSALAAMSGLSVFASGLIVAGLSHVLFTGALYLVFRQAGGSARIALAASVVYATNPHYQVFDAIFSYQTLALAFFGLTLAAAARLARQPDEPGRLRWWALAVLFTAATVITHHITSYVLALSLLIVAATGAVLRLRSSRRTAGVYRSRTIRPTVLAGICVAFIVAWITLAVPGTISYLTPVVTQLADGVTSAFTAHAAASGATPAGPLTDQLANYAAAALIVCAVPFGWVRIWRTRRRDAWALALGAGAAAYYVSALLRVTTADGAQLAGRSMTFVYIPVSFTLAMALDWLCGTARRPLRVRLARVRPSAVGAVGAVGAAAGAGILLAGGITSGWPPYWERLPGRYVVDGFESGITDDGIAAADWARTTLGPGNRIAADFSNYILMGSYGDQNVVSGVDQLYCSPSWTPLSDAIARANDVEYLLVDLRMSDHLPLGGGYFQDSSATCPAPIPRADLTKFGSVPGMNRVYDNGNIIIYALPGGQNAP